MNREIGLIFVGVEEVNDQETGEKAIPLRPISGIKASLIEKTENELKSLMSHVHPRITYHLILGEIDGTNYIVIAIEPGTDGPYETSEKAEKDKSIRLKAGRYIRVKRDTRLPNKLEEFELLKKFANFHFTSELNEKATLDDLNYEYMKEYLIATNAKPDIRAMSKLEMAQAMHLIGESEYGGYRARNFAVLMFSDKPQQFIPYARVEVIREAIGTDKMESKVFDGPIWIQAKQVIQYFKDTIQASYTIREEGRIGHRIVYNWPETMFAELETNCILHKEYDSHNYIGIYVYSDRITFVNHNRPVPPVTIADLNNAIRFDDRSYLNEEIKEMFFALDLIESYGSGIRRAKKAMEDNRSPKLIFTPDNETDDYTMATAFINEEYAKIYAEEKGNTIKRTNVIRERESSIRSSLDIDQNGNLDSNGPKLDSAGSKLDSQSLKLDSDNSKLDSQGLKLDSDNLNKNHIYPETKNIDTDSTNRKKSFDVYKKRMQDFDISSKQIQTTEIIYNAIGIGECFRRSDIALLLDCSPAKAAYLMNAMKSSRIIEKIEGVGNGWYRFVEYLE